jgi:hypothetical protein
VWQYNLCDNTICVTIQFVWQYNLCDNTTCLTIQPVWQYNFCDSTICVTVQFVWQYNMDDNTLTLNVTFILSRIFFLLPPSKHYYLYRKIFWKKVSITMITQPNSSWKAREEDFSRDSQITFKWEKKYEVWANPIKKFNLKNLLIYYDSAPIHTIHTMY